MGNIFLSYSRKDKEIVERLKDRLIEAGYKDDEVWLDIKDIGAGDSC